MAIKWAIGKEHNLHMSNGVKVLGRRIKEKSKIASKWRTKEYDFELFLKDIPNTLEQKNTYDSVDLLREGMLTLMDQIKMQFNGRNKEDISVQLLLHYPNIQPKGYFKPMGVIKLFDAGHSTDIVNYLSLHLLQLVQSEDNAFLLSDQLKIQIQVIEGFYSLQGLPSKLKFCFKTSFSREIRNDLIRKRYNNLFAMQAGRGILDFQILYQNAFDTNCVNISIYAGILLQQNMNNVLKTATYCLHNYRTLEEMNKSFERKFNLEPQYLKQLSINAQFEFIAQKIKRRIILFAQLDNGFCRYTSSTSFSRHEENLPVLLLVNESHCQLIWICEQLEASKTVFCKFCLKSFRNFKSHQCVRVKCKLCFRYKRRLNCAKEEICVTNIHSADQTCEPGEGNISNLQCEFCKKLFQDPMCFLRHKKLPLKLCMKYMFCEICCKTYSDRNHKCGASFCTKCLRIHEDNRLFCETSMREKKSKNGKQYFLQAFPNEDKIIYVFSPLSLPCQIDIFYESDCHSYYINSEMETENSQTAQSAFKIKTVFDIFLFKKLQDLEVTVFLSSQCLHSILQSIDISNWKTKFRGTKCCFAKYRNFTFIRSNDIITPDPVLLLHKLDNKILNPLYLLYPSEVENLSLNQKLSQVTMNNFCESYKSSNLKLFDYFHQFSISLDSLKRLSKLDFIEKKLLLSQSIYLKAFQVLRTVINNLYLTTIQDCNVERVPRDLFQRTSLASSVLEIFLCTLLQQPQPLTSSSQCGSIWNTSKAEICFAETLSAVHKTQFQTHRIFSYIDGDGRQYKTRQYSVDWLCIDCQVCIMVEGEYKFSCNKHKTSKNCNNKTAILIKEAERKRNAFMELNKQTFPNLKMFIIGSCCILHLELPRDFESSTYCTSNFIEILRGHLKTYKREHYKKINFQNCLPSAFTIDLCSYFKSNNPEVLANQLDISSAYLSVLQMDRFKLPKSANYDFYGIGAAANNFFKSIKPDDGNFAFVKCIICPPKNNVLPYWPIKGKDGELIYSFCNKCKLNLKNCKHSEIQRSFQIETYLNEILFMQRLGYKVLNCVQIIYFDSKFNQDLAKLAKRIRNLRSENSHLIKHFGKKIALLGVGRFSLNCSNIISESSKLISTFPELAIELKEKNFKTLDFLGENCIVSKQKKFNHFDEAKLSSIQNCSSHIFGLVSAFVRQEIYLFYLFCKKTQGLHPLRIDTDCITVVSENTQSYEKMMTFCSNSQFDYVCEHDEISEMLNFSRASRCFIKNGKYYLKIPGFSVSVSKRKLIEIQGLDDLKLRSKFSNCSDCSGPDFILFERKFSSN